LDLNLLVYFCYYTKGKIKIFYRKRKEEEVPYIFCLNGKPKIMKWLTIKVLFFLGFFGIVSKAQATEKTDQTVYLEKIIVTPLRRTTEASDLTRSAVMVDSKEINQLPVRATEEILEYIQSVDVRRRGAMGVQSDLSIRGSGFEQVLVLVDGVKMSDPQTAHHNMDLPLSMDDIERIEILRGGGTSLYGANAFGGVINIITKKPQKEGKVKLGSSRGEHNLSSQSLSINSAFDIVQSRFTIERRKSSGYRPDTDFENLSIYLNSLINSEVLPIDLKAGFLKKDFGADSFYSNLYPHEEEHIDTRFLNLKTTIDKDYFKITPLIYYRRHWDKYILDRNRPWWYVNFHTTYTYGAEIQADIDLDKAFFVFGCEARQEKITSTRLGNHSRNNLSFFSMYQPKINDRVILNVSLREDYFQDWGLKTNPAVSGGYFLTPELKLRGAVNKLFRIPSYTELYYDSPANKGNEGLVPEKGWSYEVGFDYIKDNLKFSTTSFLRKEKNVIDWARESLNDPWQVENISRLKTRGIETELTLKTPLLKEKLFISSFFCGYSYLYATHTQLASFTKYSPDYLKHQTNMGLFLEWPFDVRQSLKLSYEERVNQRHYFLLDSKISKKIKKEKFDIELFVNATNLLNTSYNEIEGVPMPGRWIEAGFNIEF
jgi:iron complex outermembrane receptor protein